MVSDMIENTKKDARMRMEKAVELLRADLLKLRTGKATPALLDSVTVDYYGSRMPIKQVANISAPEPRLLVIQPWEKNMLGQRYKEFGSNSPRIFSGWIDRSWMLCS